MILLDTNERGIIIETINNSGIEFERVDLAEDSCDISNEVRSFFFERKTMKDLYGSVISKHFTKQCGMMALKHPEGPNYVGLEGTLDEVYLEHPDQARYIESAVTYAEICLGIHFYECVDSFGLLDLVMRLDEWSRKKERFLDSFEIDENIPKPKVDDRVGYADLRVWPIKTVPGWGEKLAKQALSVFGCVANVFNASVDELMLLDKVGKKKAQKLVDFVNDTVAYNRY